MLAKNSTLYRLYYRLFICLIALLLNLFTVAHAYAWGALGHKAICDAAWRLSDRELRATLSSTAKRMGYKTFAEACIWADHIRNKLPYRHLSPLHYINVQRYANRVNNTHCLAHKYRQPQCVVTAIQYYSQQLGSTHSTTEEYDEALLLLSHFIGDLHQPLHVAYEDDRGGTQKRVVFNGKLLSLHSLWDSDILYCAYHQSWRKLGKQLSRRYKSRDIGSYETIEWANESLTLTRSIYSDLSVKLPPDYCEQYHPIAIERLGLAAKRLHHVLTVVAK